MLCCENKDKMILIEKGLNLICFKNSVVESIAFYFIIYFLFLHKIIKENTSGKYIHRAIYLNCFLALVK